MLGELSKGIERPMFWILATHSQFPRPPHLRHFYQCNKIWHPQNSQRNAHISAQVATFFSPLAGRKSTTLTSLTCILDSLPYHTLHDTVHRSYISVDDLDRYRLFYFWSLHIVLITLLTENVIRNMIPPTLKAKEFRLRRSTTWGRV